MKTDALLKRLKTFSDTDLLDSLLCAAEAERRSTADLVAHIAEVDARKLYLEQAKPSMFNYCVETLNLSEHAAYLRIYVGRLARCFPQVLDGLADGRWHLTALKLVGPHLTEENSEALLECIRSKSRRAIETELARLFPKEGDVPNRVRKLPAASSANRPGDEVHSSLTLFDDSVRTAVKTREPTAGARSEPSPPRAAPAFERHRPSAVSHCTALSESRYRLQVTLPESTQKKLETARELLRHQVPNGDLPAVLDHVLDAFIMTRMKSKFAATARPRQQQKSSAKAKRSRHIPNAVKRAVVERDGLQCSFVDAKGHRCTATGQLEFHHHMPFARGGAHGVENVSLVCRAHNGHAARGDYGPLMERYQRSPNTGHRPGGR